MTFYRRHWYEVNLVLGLAALIVAITSWNQIGTLRGLLLLNFIAFVIHQYEEYGWPGGEAWIMNKVMQPSDAPADRYPLNQNAAMVTNAFIGVPVYAICIFFPNQIWLGLGPVLVGFAQFILHGILTNIRLRWFYNPGLFAVVFGHVPIGIAYIVYISSHGLATGWDWLWGVVYTIGILVFGLVLPTYRWMAHRDSRYPFAPAEMSRFNPTKRLAHARIDDARGDGV